MTDNDQSDSPDWQQLGAPYVWMPYTQMQTAPLPVAVTRTEHVYWELADGQRLLDGLASWWTACHGYNHPVILNAVAKQLQQMPHIMFAGAQHEPALTLARRLVQLLPGSLNHVFFSDSGSVAVEVAMKMSLQYWRNIGQPQRHRFLSFRNAYHGDTAGAMSVCDPVDSMHAHFGGFLPEQYCLDLPESDEQNRQLDSFLHRHRHELAAVLIEPLVQGAGGMKFHTPQTLSAVATLCRKHNVLLIADEIATGFGRTGTMFACEQADVEPDILCCGKALTAGTLGLAATIASDEVYNAFLSEDFDHALMHGPTFMANPLACAAAIASLDLFEQHPRLEQVRHIESLLTDQLPRCGKLPGVVDIRCRGAIGVIEVEHLHHRNELRQMFVDCGVWLRPFGNIIYTTPAFVMTDVELLLLCDTIVEVVTEWSRM